MIRSFLKSCLKFLDHAVYSDSLNLAQGFFIHPSRASFRSHPAPGFLQHALLTHPVIERMELPFSTSFGRSIQLPLKFSDVPRHGCLGGYRSQGRPSVAGEVDLRHALTLTFHTEAHFKQDAFPPERYAVASFLGTMRPSDSL